MNYYESSAPANKVYTWGKVLKVIGILLLIIGGIGTIDGLIMENESLVVFIVVAGSGLAAWAGSSLFGAIAEICAAATEYLDEKLTNVQH